MAPSRLSAGLRRAFRPLLARLDVRTEALVQRGIDAYHERVVVPLEARLDELAAKPGPPEVFVPTLGLTSSGLTVSDPFMAASTCSATDYLHPRFAEIAAMWGMPPHFHRKLWEFVYIVHQLDRRGLLAPGRRGIGFGVGQEPLPAVFAARGCAITATDAPPERAARDGWSATSQFSNSLDGLHNPGIVDPQRLRELATFRTVDMNAIDEDLRGFDFAWSSCCFEHLGSLRHGLDFVINSTEQCLVPGGIGVHTTEFNLTSNDDTLELPELSFYRRRDLEALASELQDRGHRVSPLVVADDVSYLDHFVDAPPYRNDLHLKVVSSGYTITSVGLVVERGPS